MGQQKCNLRLLVIFPLFVWSLPSASFNQIGDDQQGLYFWKTLCYGQERKKNASICCFREHNSSDKYHPPQV